MKNVFTVFKRDIKSMFTNPVALIIIIGLCIIPSLYAWINIVASWDPYSNTGTMPVAIVNNDAGATLNGKNINIGDGVITELHSNDKIGWKFVTQSEANKGIIDGSYYAMIEIPSNFSKDLASVTTNNPKKADIIYKVNTKINPVSGKITGVAESTLVNQIKTTFLESVNTEIFSKLNAVGDKLEQNKNNILNLKKSVININNNMGAINTVLAGVSTGSANLSTYIDTVKGSLPSIRGSLNNVQNITVNTGSIIDNTNSTLNMAFNNISVNLDNAKSNISNIQQDLSEINTESATSTQAKALISSINSNLANVNASVTSVLNFLETVNKSIPNKGLQTMIGNINNIKGAIESEMKTLSTASATIDSGQELKADTLNSIKSGISNISNSLDSTISNYNGNTKGQLKSIGGNLSSSTKTAAGLINQANGLVGKIQNVVDTASSNTKMAGSTANSLRSTMDQFSGVISSLAKNLGEINNNDLSQMVSVLQGNPAIMGNFISTPFNIQQESIFKIDNYGSGMTPMYTVLAIWVGALLLTSLLKTNPPKFEGLEKISLREQYFGKLLTFMSIVIIQTIIMTVGNKFLLGVQTANLPLFIILGIITGIVFCIIIFTLVSLFGNFGKAIVIVLMVVQIAGAGGTYPVQVLPLFFRVVQPIMPFSYALGAFREAVAGPIFDHVKSDLIALGLFAIIFLLLGYFLKPHMHPRLTKFEKKFEESGIGE